MYVPFAALVSWVWRVAYAKLLLAIVWAVPLELPLLPASETPAMAAADLTIESPALGSARAIPPEAGIAHGARDAHTIGKSTVRMPALFCLAWLLGLAGCVLATARQWRAVRQWRASSTALDDRLLESVLRDEARRLGVRRLPQLRLSPIAPGPLVTGIRHPAIVLPAGIRDQFSAAEIRLILAHELAHVRRGDLAWNWLPVAVRSLFFFHPLVWFTLGRGRKLRKRPATSC